MAYGAGYAYGYSDAPANPSGPPLLEPNYLIWFAPGYDAKNATPSWVDISRDLISVSTVRGSPAELDRNNPGIATVVVDNWAGAYDSANAGGPYYGDLVPNVRIKIIAEYDGVLYPTFDGLIDAYVLDYPDAGEATCTITATDGFKAFARTDLPASAYVVDVLADSPVALWPLSEPDAAASYLDAIGTGHLGRYGAPESGPALVSRDATSSTEMPLGTDGVAGPYAPLTGTPFSFEAVYQNTDPATGTFTLVSARGSGPGTFQGFQMVDGFVTVVTSAGTNTAETLTDLNDGDVHHIAVTVSAAGVIKIYVDGVDDTDVPGTVAAGTFSGTVPVTVINAGPAGGGVIDGGLNAAYQYVALYPTQLSAARVAAHAAAVTTPWNGDTPKARLDRISDYVGLASALRDFDTGTSTLQSAELAMTALEHAQKVTESDFGDLFFSRDGTLTFEGRLARLNRPSLATFGDDDGEVGYTGVRFDDGELVLRNPVTVSRIEGSAQTAKDTALIDKYYPNQYTLDGLFHNSDQVSRDAADLILALYKTPRRRITGLTLGPARVTHIGELYPLILTLELGYVVTVTFRPPNVVAPFTQVSTIEGIRNSWNPTDGHVVELDLSPVAGDGTSAYRFIQLDNAEVTIEGANAGRIIF